jgi:hypothetical protein
VSLLFFKEENMERSSAARTAGAVVREVTLSGTTYTLSTPDTVRKAADEEAVIVGRRLDTLQALVQACDALPAERRGVWVDNYVKSMIVGMASPQEWEAYFNSLWRDAFRLWHALDPKHKEGKTLLEGVRWAYEAICAPDVSGAELTELRLAIRIVSQEEVVKNSSGSEGAATPPTEDQSTEAGQPSTPTS